MPDFLNEGISLTPIPDSPGGGAPGVTGVKGGGEGWGGTGDAWNPHGTPDMYSGFVISGGGGNQAPVSGGGGLTPAVDAHYYKGYWAGVQAAMYAPPQSLPRSPAPYPIPGYGPDDPFPIPNFEPSPGVNTFKPAPNTIIARISAAISAALAPPAEAGESVGLGTRASANEWPADLPDWPPAPWPATMQNSRAYNDSDAMPGAYWTSAVFPTRPVSSDFVDWNPQPGFYPTERLTSDDIFGDHSGTPNWFNSFGLLGSLD